ncbi:MAG: zinc ribbon domain-containing protein [Clostridiales bacterium]|nr:zinc ribbon domain-containing protein [Clostridiales bacterium]
MPIYAICPICSKTIEIARLPKLTCPECGSQFGYAELQRKHLLVDEVAERTALNAAKDYFMNGDFSEALEHFKHVLESNQNSYAAKYYIMMCEMYLNEGKGDPYKVMPDVVDMIRQSLLTLSHANVTIEDKLAFITAMLSETKIIITRRLLDRDELFEKDIDEYRKLSISDLTVLLNLFTLDRELIMSFAPEVAKALSELVDCAIKVCYKAVQTVMHGNKLLTPNDADYKKLSALVNELCFFGHSLDPNFDSSPYSPDFTQNYGLNEKLLNKFEDFDRKNQANAKKHIIGDIKAYEALQAECAKMLKFTYLNCYRSMCSRQVARHAQLFFDGFELIYRLLLPNVVQVEGKHIEVRTNKYSDIEERCDMLTRFLVDAYELDENIIGAGLHAYYEKLYDIVSAYYVPEIEKMGKSKARNNLYYQQLLYDCACSCVPALRKYVDFSLDVDKVRAKLVKICRNATEEFLLHAGITIDEIEQSNFFRPMLHISNALVEEENA